MDFPVCPACGQSVIDDDAEDCPFCGASMKSKPGAKPVQKVTTGTGTKPTAAAKPGVMQAKSGGGAKPAAGKSDGDDFPFDTDIPGSKTAVQAMPAPSKGRSLKIICPMCETAGYVPPASAGKEVKCANPKCMVPIFKAPVAVVEAPPPPPPKKSNVMLVGGITAALMAIGGGAAYYVATQPVGKTQAPKAMSEEDLKLLRETQDTKPAIVINDKNKPKPFGNGEKNTEKPVVDSVPKGPEEIIKAALKQMNDSSLNGDRNRSKPYCRQLAAEACAIAGDTAAADAHMAQLVVVGASVSYYRIEPNLELFWRAWQAGDKPAATNRLKAATDDAPKLKIVGRHQLEVASRLSAALAAVGRIPDALKQLEGHQSSELEGQVAARVQMASDGKIARLTGVRSVLPWRFPQAVAATDSLITHGQVPAARAWAVAQTEEDSQAECLAIWAESVARHQANAGVANGSSEIVEAAKGMEPALAARVWARAACGRFAAGDLDGAAATLKVAGDLLASAPAPSEQIMPEIKLTNKTELPDSVPLVRAATAAAEIAFAYTLLPERTQDAEGALELALMYARGIAPGLPAVMDRLNEAEQAGSNGLRDLLKKQMMLKGDDQGRQAVGTYRRKLAELKEAAERRLKLQTMVLSKLAQSGLKNKVWIIVSDRSVDPNLSLRDDFTSTQLIGELLELFRGTETEKIITGAIPAGYQIVRPEFAVVRELLQNANVQEAGEYVTALDANSGLRDDVALTFATYLGSVGKVEVAFGFIGRLTDEVLREEAYRLTAGLATQRGQTEAAWKQVTSVSQATEKCSLCRGVVAGLKLGAAEKDLPERAFAP